MGGSKLVQIGPWPERAGKKELAARATIVDAVTIMAVVTIVAVAIIVVVLVAAILRPLWTAFPTVVASTVDAAVSESAETFSV